MPNKKKLDLKQIPKIRVTPEKEEEFKSQPKIEFKPQPKIEFTPEINISKTIMKNENGEIIGEFNYGRNKTR